MHHLTLDLSQYEGKQHKPDSQEERISFLITTLRAYNRRSSKELQSVMPMLYEVQQHCKDYDAHHHLVEVNYILEIIKALEAEYFNSEIRYTFTTNVVVSADYSCDELFNELEV